MINLMDHLLKNIDIDFHFTPYKVLAMSDKEGMLEFVANSKTVQSIRQEYNNKIDDYIREKEYNKLTR